MDEQSGEPKMEEVMGVGIGETGNHQSSDAVCWEKEKNIVSTKRLKMPFVFKFTRRDSIRPKSPVQRHWMSLAVCIVTIICQSSTVSEILPFA